MPTRRVNFVSTIHGFHFPNRFRNRVIGGGETRGRCGGMAYAALDYWYANHPIPSLRTEDFPGSDVPPDGHPLAEYIGGRLRDSFTVVGSSFNFVSWSVASPQDTMSWTRENEFPRLIREFIDSGRPAPLGLINADVLPWGFLGLGALERLGDNHQVVAYGYKNDVSQPPEVYIYDVNYPNKESVLTIDSSSAPGVWQEFTQESGSRVLTGDRWRGFFIQIYDRVSINYPPQVCIQCPPWMSLWYDWRNFPSVSPGLASSVAYHGVASRGPNRLDVFEINGNTLFTITREGEQWGRWGSLGSPTSGLNTTFGPSAISWSSNRLDVFVLGNDGNIWTLNWEQGRPWSGWSRIAAPDGGASSGPAVSSRGANRLDVFVLGNDGNIWTRNFEPATQWSPWGSLSAPPNGIRLLPRSPTVASISWSSNRLDVFVLGNDGNIWTLNWEQGRPWSGWSRIAAPDGGASSGPAVSSWSPNRLDIFILGSNGSLWTRNFEPATQWSPWQDLGITPEGPNTFGPAAISTKVTTLLHPLFNKIDVLTVNSRGANCIKSYGW